MDAEGKKSKYTKNKNQTNEVPHNDNIIKSLDDLKLQYPDLIDETTISTFPGEKYHINLDASIPPKCTALRPVPLHQQIQFKAEPNKMLKHGSD